MMAAVLRPLSGVALTCSLLLGCSAQSDTDLLASAQNHMRKGEQAYAIIQLKSALQQNPQSGEARYLLGKALLETGKPEPATIELQRALVLKHDESQVVPVLAAALLQQGDPLQVVERFDGRDLPDDQAQAALKTTLALAHGARGDTVLAAKSVEAALASDPEHTPALLLQARLVASKQDFAAAMAILDGVITREPQHSDAWLLRGEIQHLGLRDAGAALASYREAAKLRNDLLAAHHAIVGLLVESRQLDEARQHVAALKQTLPDQPGTRLLEAQMAFMDRDYKSARDIAVPLVQLAPKNALVLQLAGASEFALGALPQAENLLAEAVRINPGMPLATHVLARTYLRTGQPEKALETLRPLLAMEQPSAEALLLAGEAHLQTGEAARAEQSFAQAAKVRPDSSRARAALALSQIGKGQTASGIAALESLSLADSGTTADMALVSQYLRRKELGKALQAAEGLVKKVPQSPAAENLRGRILALSGSAAAARASFERALTLDGRYFPALASLTALDLTEKKPEAARQRLQTELKTDPKNHRAMLAMASLLQRTGGSPEEVRGHLENAVKASPAEALPRLQLIEYHLKTGNNKSALVAAQDANAAMPDRRELLAALGHAQLANHAFQQALTSFSRLATLQPASEVAALGVAQALVGQDDPGAAQKHLEKALQLNPKLVTARRMLAGLYAAGGRYTEAIALARELHKQLPRQSVGQLLESEIEMQWGQWDAALTLLRAAHQKSPGTETASRIHAALNGAGRNEEADRFASGWLKERPRDAAFRFYLGDAALSRNQLALAETRYREVLQLQPENPLALNNVAWLMVRQSKPGAVALAEKATTLLPGRTPLLDTLALALAAENQLARALELHRKTVEMAPQDPTLKLTLARLYLQAGAKPQAKAQLEELVKLGERFREHAEVVELLKQV